ncbi:hypothetical protein OG381_48000 [Streptomyces sp. NBC_00490]|uniref:hypothetical protein n=1 Tax=Streptomyces sp. NBC_00490 TaxID=2903657 RepID=UPI002E180B78
MPKLGEVLGGLLTDVLRARLAADALTAQAVEAYREDPVLASFSVPRVTVADLTVRLRFLVTDVTVPEPVRPDRVRAGRLWNAVIRDRVLPLLSTAHPDAGLEEVVRLLQDAVRKNPIPVGEAELDRAVGGDTTPLADATLAQVAERIGALPPAARDRLAKIRWKDEIRQELARRAGPFAERVRQWAAAEQALRSRVEVEVSADRLQERPVETLQQLELTVSLADVEEFIDLATRTEP